MRGKSENREDKGKFRLGLKLAIGDSQFGPGKARLLELIHQEGSISAAAREMGMNYRRAWYLVETLQTALGRAVVETAKGGAGGGGASLTPAGRDLIAAYRDIAAKAEAAAKPLLEDLDRKLE